MTDVERLFRAYHEPLVRYLTRRLGDRDWAEEVAQETFVRALRQGELQNERAWLFAVATNLVRDEARKDARRRRHLELLREEGLDYHEIAEALGLSVGSIGTTLARARRRLVEQYEALQQAMESRRGHAAS